MRRATGLLLLLTGPFLLADPPAKELPWLPSLAAGYAQATQRKEGVLVRVGGAGCPWCRKLDQDLARPEVQTALTGWTLVYLDQDQEAAVKDLRSLAITGIPALRVFTPRGRLIAAVDGYVEPEKLIAWLREHAEAARALPPDDLTASGEPSAEAVGRILVELKRRDPVIREAAVRRLLPYPQLAAAPAVEAFAEGGLQTRLALIELLQQWQAPVADLDPWNPATLTDARLGALKAWAQQGEKAAPARDLTPGDLAAARQELDRLIRVPDLEAAACRERLARCGPGLLPEVTARLKEAPTDQARERLTALRYRLVATDTLALQWAGGLERLAATAAPTRHRAVQELAGRATAAEEPLLLELFSDPDPLVRELSLRALYTVAGGRAAETLTRLLKDPEPNVRAAVLKQLAERPSVAMVPHLQAYIAAETDLDLVAHAVRALREVKAKTALEALRDLTKHASWRVRAEAAEGLVKAVEGKEDAFRNLDPAFHQELKKVLVRLLEDPDGFVASRPLKVLGNGNDTTLIEPLAKLSERLPELSAEVAKQLAHFQSARDKVMPHFRRFFASPNADVRAAAVEGLIAFEPAQATQEIDQAIKDTSPVVRRAALAALWGHLRGLRPAVERQPGQDVNAAERDKKLDAWRGGQDRAEWLKPLPDRVAPLLTAQGPEERLYAALILVALAREAQGLPVALAVARERADLVPLAGQALPWLPWAQRLAVFHQLLDLKPGPEPLAEVIETFAADSDPRTVDPLWTLAGRDGLHPAGLGAILNAFYNAYFARRYAWDRQNVTPAMKKAAVAAAQARLQGTDHQRRLALALMLFADPDAAREAAAALIADPKAGADLRTDAFKVQTVALSRGDAQQLALEHLGHADAHLRKAALFTLAFGTWANLTLLDGDLTLQTQDGNVFSEVTRSGGAVKKPKAPVGLTGAAVRPLLKDPDPKAAAAAGYLLALLGEPEGLGPLVRYWRERAPTDDTWMRLVYRAVAAAGDDGQTRLLEEVYQVLRRSEDSDLADFYWTIRTMDGPNVLRLRKQIRAEVGMDRLQNNGIREMMP